MKEASRQYSLLDKFLITLNNGLTTVTQIPKSSRPIPGGKLEEVNLNKIELRKIQGMMRVNHAGEVCAQALYEGQAITAKNKAISLSLQESAIEENDHLNWCANRLKELGSHTSFLNPVWYTGSLAIGIAVGMCGDNWNLGFLAETERQVCKHLQGHLEKMPSDNKSKAILKQMEIDEEKHAKTAISAGAYELPWVAKIAMRLSSKVMTKLAYYI